jgi:hypothetical protein
MKTDVKTDELEILERPRYHWRNLWDVLADTAKELEAERSARSIHDNDMKGK